MTREDQLQQWLFEAMHGYRTGTLSPDTVRNALSHCLCSDNAAVAKRAAELLSQWQPPDRFLQRIK